MLTLAVLTICYFLPSILARNRSNFLPIFLLNFFLGWTVIGWIIALVWSLAQPQPLHMVVVPAPVALRSQKFCCACGAPTPSGYCPHCGKLWA